jgi:hypothetical protein
MARVEAEKRARADRVNSINIWLRIAPVLMDEVEAERGLYAIKPTKAEVARQLLSDGLVFRTMFRPRSMLRRRRRLQLGLPDKPAKGVPFKFSFED